MENKQIKQTDSWENFHAEVIRIKYLLNSNDFPIKLIEKEVNKFVSPKVKNLNNEVRDKINFQFCNKMSEHYNKEVKKLKDIIYNQVHSVNENSSRF